MTTESATEPQQDLETKLKAPVSRREFLKTAARAAIKTVKILAIPTIIGGATKAGAEMLPQEKHSPSLSPPPEKIIPATASEIVKRIKENYGIEIPQTSGEEYALGDEYVKLERQSGVEISEKDPAVLTYEEARIIEDTLAQIPSTDALVSLIIPYRYKSISEVAEVVQGTYLGRTWRQWSKDGPATCTENLKLGKELDKRSAIFIFLPESLNISSPLPDLENLRPYPFPGQTPAEGKEEIPRTTQGERFKQVLAHEMGHALLDQVAWAFYKTPEKHCAAAHYSMCGLTSMEEEQPLFQSFSQINGWKLASGKEILKSCDIDVEGEEYEKERGWVRDKEIWGNPPQVRLSYRASEDNIEETFSEFFMTYILYPNLLHTQEKYYFESIILGLKKDPLFFFQEVSANPNRLLQSLDMNR